MAGSDYGLKGAPRGTAAELIRWASAQEAPSIAAQLDELYMADIRVPPSLYAEPRLGLGIGPLFAQEDIVRLR